MGRLSLVLAYVLASSLESTDAFILPQSNSHVRTDLSATIIGRTDSRLDPFEQWEWERKFERPTNQYNSNYGYNTNNGRYQQSYGNSYVDRVNSLAPYNRLQSSSTYPRSQFDQSNYSRNYNVNTSYNRNAYQPSSYTGYSNDRREPYNNGLQAGFDYNSGTFLSNERKNAVYRNNERRWNEQPYRQGYQQVGQGYAAPYFYEGDIVQIARGTYAGKSGTVVQVQPNLLKVRISSSDTVFIDIKDIDTNRSHHTNNRYSNSEGYGQPNRDYNGRRQQNNRLVNWDSNSAYGQQRNGQYTSDSGWRQQNNRVYNSNSYGAYGPENNARLYSNSNQRRWDESRDSYAYQQNGTPYVDSPFLIGDTVQILQGTHSGKKGTVKKIFPGMVSVKFGENESVLVSNKDIDYDHYSFSNGRAANDVNSYNYGNSSPLNNNRWNSNSVSSVQPYARNTNGNQSYQTQRRWDEPRSGYGTASVNSPFMIGDTVRISQGSYSGKSGIVKKVYPETVSVELGENETVLIENKNIDLDDYYNFYGRSGYGYGSYYGGRSNGQYVSNRSRLMSQNQRQNVSSSQRLQYDNNSPYRQSNTALNAIAYSPSYYSGDFSNRYFSKGDRVQITDGSYAGRTATVLNYFLDGLRLCLSQPGKVEPAADILVEKHKVINLDDIYRMNGVFAQGYV
jgi:ribosomal protein L24